MPQLKQWAWAFGVLAMFMAIGAWVYGMDQTKEEVAQTKEEVAQQRTAITKINERVEVHITRQRYQECYVRCIAPSECPPEPKSLPQSRCERE